MTRNAVVAVLERVSRRRVLFYPKDQKAFLGAVSTNARWALVDTATIEYFNDDTNARLSLYRYASSRTGMKNDFWGSLRSCNLQQMVEYTIDQGLSGDIVELGCFRGRSALMIATLLDSAGFDGSFHIFDSFQGISQPTSGDSGRLDGSDDEPVRGRFSASRESVEAVLESFDCVRIHEGWIPERFDEVADRSFALVHIDVDLYEPTRDSINFFFPRLADGGVMVFDDYGSASFQGATRAIDTFLQTQPHSFFYEVPTGGAFVIK